MSEIAVADAPGQVGATNMRRPRLSPYRRAKAAPAPPGRRTANYETRVLAVLDVVKLHSREDIERRARMAPDNVGFALAMLLEDGLVERFIQANHGRGKDRHLYRRRTR